MLLIILNTLLLMCKVYYTQLYFYVLDFKSNDDLLSFRSWRHISFWQFTFTIYKPFVRLRNRKAKELLIANSIHSLSQYIATDYLGSKTYQTNAIWKIKFLPSYSFKALHWNSLTSLRIWIWYLLRCLLSSAFSKFHLLGLRYQENIKWYSLNLGTQLFLFTAIFQRCVEHVWFHHSGRQHYWCHRHCWGWLLEAVPCG